MASPPVVKSMAMEGNPSEDSYAQHSVVQNENFHAAAKPLLQETVDQLVRNIAARRGEPAQGRKPVAIADLGCSYGRNTLECAEFILGALQQNWGCDAMPEIQYFFSDLPSNDFNALFQSLYPYIHHPPNCNNIAASHVATESNLPRMFAAGVPGSFHGRLFPSASLDLVICSYALHWLSQVPSSVVDRSSPAWNGGRLWVRNSSQSVLDAYAMQSQIDMRNFFKSRTHELASGGILFLLHLGVTNILKNDSSANDRSPMELLECAWKEMVNEGKITMDEMDMFNIPMYVFNQHELENVLKDIPEFKILHIKTIIVSKERQENFKVDTWIETVTSITKPLVREHLGEEKSKDLYKKLKIIGSKQNALKPSLSYNLVIASLQRL